MLRHKTTFLAVVSALSAAAALDSGCVWGGSLTALRLEDRALYQVPCRGYQTAGEE